MMSSLHRHMLHMPSSGRSWVQQFLEGAVLWGLHTSSTWQKSSSRQMMACLVLICTITGSPMYYIYNRITVASPCFKTGMLHLMISSTGSELSQQG